jgi:hypothetical protein
MTPAQLELIAYIACATLGFSISQMLSEYYEMRRIRKAVERVANRLEKLKD